MTPNTDTPPSPNRRPARVLVAEDSPLNLQVALMQLEKLGYAADAVTDGRQALEALQRGAYDIILMDCQMPEMDGYEATWQIRDREQEQARTSGNEAHVKSTLQAPSPGLPSSEGESLKGGAGHIYIIAMTANTEADNREKCLAAGMDDFIVKPVQLPELEAVLLRALADRATQQAMDEVIDATVIAGLRQLRIPGKPDPLARLIELFLSEAPGRLDALQQAITSNDMNSLTRASGAASALKGSAGNLGARNLAALCDEIEQAVKSGFLADASPLVLKAREEYNRVRETLDRIKSESAAGG